jgi:nitroreductase
LDCSHFVVFAARTKITDEDIDRHVARTAEVRGRTVEALKRFRDGVASDLVTGTRAAEAREWAARQAYIALGNFMTSAALLGIDTCPMEGFEPDEYDEILELPAKRLTSVVCCAAGYRSVEDKRASRKKVRFSRDDVIHIV